MAPTRKKRVIIRKKKVEIAPVVRNEDISSTSSSDEDEIPNIKKEIKEERIDEEEEIVPPVPVSIRERIISSSESSSESSSGESGAALVDSGDDEEDEEKEDHDPLVMAAAAVAALPNRDGKDNLANSKENASSLSRPPPNKKHRCLQSEIPTSRPISGAETCSPGNPAHLPLSKVKLHYVVHYLHRGAFNAIVPELHSDADKAKVEGYECNVCGKKFKNNINKNEYPARGSFVCHLATEHGKILDAMRDDKEVDMAPVIELLAQYDKQFREFTITGTKTDKDHKLVTVKESILWRMQHASNADKSSSQNGVKASSFYAQKPTFNSGGGYFACPKCDQMSRNRNTYSLKIHLTQHHYRERWNDRLDRVTGGNKEATDIACDLCKVKKSGGSVAMRVRNEMVCHWALEHDELKEALVEDDKVGREFIDRLYNATTSKTIPTPTPAAAASSMLTKTSSRTPESVETLRKFDKNFEQNKTAFKRGRPASSPKRKAKMRKEADSDSDSEDVDDPSDYDSSSSSEPEMPQVKKTLSGKLNTNYVRKRTKVNFTLESDEDDDVDVYKPKKVTDVGKTRSLPKRASRAARGKFVEENISDEEDI